MSKRFLNDDSNNGRTMISGNDYLSYPPDCIQSGSYCMSGEDGRNFYLTDKMLSVDEKIEAAVKNEMIATQKELDKNIKAIMENDKEMSKVYEDNGITFKVEDNGTTTARTTVKEDPASRKGMQSIHPDGYDSKNHDKGHLIAAREGGPAKDLNVHAQDRNLNRGAFKTVENNEVKLANKGYEVQTEKTAYVSHKGAAPDAYMVNDTITAPNGEKQHVHLSFQNMSPSEQQEMNNTTQNEDFEGFANPDPLRESMNVEEHNELMEETDKGLSSVKDEFDMDMTNETTFSSDEALAAQDQGVGETGVVDAGVDVGIDGGIDGGVDGGTDGGTDGGADGGADGGMDAD